MFEFHPSILSCSFVKYPSIKPFDNVKIIIENLKIKKSFKNDKAQENEVEPILFSLFGSKDILILSENYSLDIINKLLVNHCHDISGVNMCEEPFYGILQNISGFTLASESPNILDNIKDKLYVAFTQIKLNSAYLFSGGTIFINDIIDLLKEKIGNNVEYRIIISFSTYELCLLYFSDEFSILQEKVLEIRELKYNWSNGSYLSFYNAIGCKNFDKHNLFSDTQTIFGVRIYENSDNKDGQQNNLPFIIDDRFYSPKEIELEIDISWKIKPGYLQEFLKSICDTLKDRTDLLENITILPGKSDFKFQHYFTNSDYWEIFKKYHENGDFKRYIRSFVSSIVHRKSFSISSTIPQTPMDDPLFDHIKYLSFNLQQIREIDLILKDRIGLSDNLRYRVMKMYHLYNSGISNTITFNIYFDLYLFLEQLKLEIEKISTSPPDKIEMLSIQHYFEEILSYYEKAYHIRMMQNLNHDDSSEVLINFNTSLPGYISTIDSFTKLITSHIKYSISRKEHAIPSSTITVLDLIKTKSSGYFANFDLTSSFVPGLLFSYLSKEVYVLIFKDSDYKLYLRSFYENYGAFWNQAVKTFFRNDQTEFENISTFGSATLEYFFMDYLRFIQFFKSDFELFLFWYNATILQVSTNYEQNGRLNEKQWFLELLRLAFVNKMADNNSSQVEFIKLNPFDADIYRYNFIIWEKLAKKAYDLIELFLTPSNNLEEFIKSISSREEVTNHSENFETLQNKIMQIEPTSENVILTKLGQLSISLIQQYFQELKSFFGSKIFLIHDKGCTDRDTLNFIKNNTEIDKLFISSGGAFWFRTHSEAKKYNKTNFKYLHLLSHLALMYKMSTFLKLIKKNNLLSIP